MKMKTKIEVENKKIIIKFYGIDSWNRPIFKSVEDKMFFGSCFHLFGYDAEPKKIIEFFKKNINALVYMGSYFDCEPMGTPISEFKTPTELVIL